MKSKFTTCAALVALSLFSATLLADWHIGFPTQPQSQVADWHIGFPTQPNLA